MLWILAKLMSDIKYEAAFIHIIFVTFFFEIWNLHLRLFIPFRFIDWQVDALWFGVELLILFSLNNSSRALWAGPDSVSILCCSTGPLDPLRPQEESSKTHGFHLRNVYQIYTIGPATPHLCRAGRSCGRVLGAAGVLGCYCMCIHTQWLVKLKDDTNTNMNFIHVTV